MTLSHTPPTPVEGRLIFYGVRAKGIGIEQVFRIAAGNHADALRLVRETFPWYRRLFLRLEWAYDLDPTELTELGYLQKLKHMHVVQDLDDILDGVQYR